VLAFSSLLSGLQYRLDAAIIFQLFPDHVAQGLTAFAAIYAGLVVGVNLRGGASARRDGVVHFRCIKAPTYTDDHATHLQYLRVIVNRETEVVP
jgi:hypothetical protein